jgi:hypothetical protein
LLVQAIKALREKHITLQIIDKLRQKLTDKEKKTALSESQYITGRVYEIIKKIAEEGNLHG